MAKIKVPCLIAVMGPTASGKSSFAEFIAEELDAALINADAFQIYRGLDIGTAKPLSHSRYHLLDIRNPDQDFGVGEYVVLAAQVLQDVFARGKNAVIVGGTGFYIRALVEQYTDLMNLPDAKVRQELMDRELVEGVSALANELARLSPEIASKVDLKNGVRVRRALERLLSPSEPIVFKIPDFCTLKIGIIPDAEESEAKIGNRLHEMIQNGWVAEVEGLLKQGYGAGDPGFRALGYMDLVHCIRGEGLLEDHLSKIKADTVSYAKRQRTWLRSEPNLKIFTTLDQAKDEFPTLIRSID